MYEMFAILCVKWRVSERDGDIERSVTVRRRASATGAPTGATAGGGCGRSAGSWRKLRRPRDVRQFRDEYSDLPPTAVSPQRCTVAQSLDDTISTTLEQLRVIQDEDCCVVRCFNTTANGLINRGDSFKRKNESLLHSSTDGLPGQDIVQAGASRSRSQSSSNSHASYTAVPSIVLADDMVDVDRCDAVPTVPPVASYTVLVLGQQQVGRTALLQQFMTSQFMAAQTTDSECDKTVSVLLDGLETTLSFVELPLPVQQDCMRYGEIEAYLVVFSLTDRQSFRYACEILRLLRHQSRTDAAVILVANKSDLVRARRVSDDEARWMCRAMRCKYIQVSAALNHHVDDLLAGLVHQIRLNPERQSATSNTDHHHLLPTAARAHSPTPRCFTAARDCFLRLIGKNTSSTFDCDDLWTL